MYSGRTRRKPKGVGLFFEDIGLAKDTECVPCSGLIRSLKNAGTHETWGRESKVQGLGKGALERVPTRLRCLV